MTILPIECSHDNPMRPPAWRWLRVQYLLDNGRRPFFRWDDSWIGSCLRFHRRLAACDTEQERDELKHAGRHFHYAWLLWSEHDELRRSIVEARLLAGESFESIGGKHAMPADTVRAYEAIYYNVLELRNRPAYILHTAIGPRLQRIASGRPDWPTLFKLVGYSYGASFLDWFIRGYEYELRPSSDREVTNAFSEIQQDALRFRSFVALLTMPVDARTAPALMTAAARIHALEVTHGGPPTHSPAFQEGVERVMVDLAAGVGGGL